MWTIQCVLLAWHTELNKVLKEIISETQTGFMKGRCIGECRRLICDLIDKCDENEIPGLLIVLDLEKALHSIEWLFICKSLQCFDVGESITQWFKVLYCNSESIVQNNGHLSEHFNVNRGTLYHHIFSLNCSGTF